jgi:hypothetical protein
MPVSVVDAAAALGFRSRSTLYRLLDQGLLKDWERTGPKGQRWLELEGLQAQIQKFVRLQSNSPKQKPEPNTTDDAPRPFDVVAELWAPITPRINRVLIAQGFVPLSPENVLAVVRAAEDAITAEAPEWDTESPEWWAAALEDASPDDPCPDPWRCQHCGEPWHTNHPDYRQPPAAAVYVAELRKRYGVASVESVNAAA